VPVQAQETDESGAVLLVGGRYDTELGSGLLLGAGAKAIGPVWGYGHIVLGEYGSVAISQVYWMVDKPKFALGLMAAEGVDWLSIGVDESPITYLTLAGGFTGKYQIGKSVALFGAYEYKFDTDSEDVIGFGLSFSL